MCSEKEELIRARTEVHDLCLEVLAFATMIAETETLKPVLNLRLQALFTSKAMELAHKAGVLMTAELEDIPLS